MRARRVRRASVGLPGPTTRRRPPARASLARGLLAFALAAGGLALTPGLTHTPALALTPGLALTAALAQSAPPAAGGTPGRTAAGNLGATADSGSANDIQLSGRAYAIASKLRCPVCTAESVADSDAQISAEMRTMIQQQLDAGKSEAQIIRYFKQRYGDWILLDPPKRGVHLLVWLLPALALLAGAVGLGLLFRRWRAAAEQTPQPDPEALARVRRALAAQTGGAGSGGGSDGDGEGGA